MIRRSEHDAANRYAQISRKLAQDKSLSFGARGLMLYILSKPSNWEVKYLDLMREGGIGRDALRSLMRELKEAGYFRCTKTHGTHGQFTYEQVVLEEPEPPSEDALTAPEDDAEVELPSVGSPVTENPPLAIYKERAGARAGFNHKTEEHTRERVGTMVNSVTAHVLKRSRPNGNGHSRKPKPPEKTLLPKDFVIEARGETAKFLRARAPDVNLSDAFAAWKSGRLADAKESADWEADFQRYVMNCQMNINTRRKQYQEREFV